MIHVLVTFAVLISTCPLFGKVAALDISVGSKPLTSFAADAYTKIVIQPLNIAGNKVGLSANDLCFVVKKIGAQGTFVTIHCSSGKEFTDIAFTQSSRTGTPGHITYPQYIGYTLDDEPTPGLMGSGKRTDYYIPVAKK